MQMPGALISPTRDPRNVLVPLQVSCSPALPRPASPCPMFVAQSSCACVCSNLDHFIHQFMHISLNVLSLYGLLGLSKHTNLQIVVKSHSPIASDTLNTCPLVTQKAPHPSTPFSDTTADTALLYQSDESSQCVRMKEGVTGRSSCALTQTYFFTALSFFAKGCMQLDCMQGR